METKKLTVKQYLKLPPESFVMVTYEFENPVYIWEADDKGLSDMGTPPWRSFDNNPSKLSWYIAKTGYKGLMFEPVAHETKAALKEGALKIFGCTDEQIKKQYAANARALEKMRDKAIATGKKVNNYTAQELIASAYKYNYLAK